ncbi:phosphopyruvate hydratase [[Mycoplasma] mobile]|uniref:Enolase n=1 Tax=Mycoplasma mobile (strain ATCC 43663 / 163K / NCTC 11711) TaxID=267748 RepID=ENO_MYCM1|nr:phosphopyruvate hydratase [[Mycoplasma] mobile]Q6KIB0.1 RecName: Full=Enolase; AltName: Full=2-phospho-D-glycerate hydro-lyase; AltName: Full=2-phosphoglycerate dehydratase [Mycoplasma mobile 163K]AAT27666.1 enolase [Mycoplasma mobile 163K]
MSAIMRIHAREVLDSRGNPTIQIEVESEYGYGSAMVPSGASTGEKEAKELRDKGTKYEKNWYGGKGVQTAVDNVNNIIAPKIEGYDVLDQRAIDYEMIKLDGTEFKEKLGANAILGVSLAVAKAAADELNIPLYRYVGGTNGFKLPVPMLNVINGGEHASNTVDFQEFLIMPIGAKTFKEAMQVANKVFHNLKDLLASQGHSTAVGDEGGFAPDLKSHEEVLDFIVSAIKKAGYEPSKKGDKAVAIAIDAASSELFDKKSKTYTFKKLKKAILTKQPGFENLGKVKVEYSSDELVEYFKDLFKKYPIISLEDGFSEHDWDAFTKLNNSVGATHQIMGDDLVTTNPKFIKKAIETKAINSVLIKLNQIGTLSETMDAIEMAHKAGMTCVVSHRSGETEDTTIADLAVALNTGQIKTGSISRTDRVAKYNRLLVIEEELGIVASYEGIQVFHNLKVK